MHTPVQRHAENKSSRQGPLAISAILNEEPIDPIPYRPAPEPSPPWTVVDKFEHLGYFPSPMSTLSSPGPLRNERSNTPQIDAGSEAMWDYPSAGMHQTHSGEIIISSLAKAKRKRILPHQFNRLMEVFTQTNTPSSEIREQLANELEMTKREVQVWFQNRRAKVNRAKAKAKASGCLTIPGHRRQQRSHSVAPLSRGFFNETEETLHMYIYLSKERVHGTSAFQCMHPRRMMPTFGHPNPLYAEPEPPQTQDTMGSYHS